MDLFSWWLRPRPSTEVREAVREAKASREKAEMARRELELELTRHNTSIVTLFEQILPKPPKGRP